MTTNTISMRKEMIYHFVNALPVISVHTTTGFISQFHFHFGLFEVEVGDEKRVQWGYSFQEELSLDDIRGVYVPEISKGKMRNMSAWEHVMLGFEVNIQHAREESHEIPGAPHMFQEMLSTGRYLFDKLLQFAIKHPPLVDALEAACRNWKDTIGGGWRIEDATNNHRAVPSLCTAS